MERIQHKPWHDQPYVIIDKQPINNANLSFKALGLLVYIISKPADWHICLKHLATTHKEGIDAVRSAMEELITQGYAKRSLVQDTEGRIQGYQTIVAEVPFPPDPVEDTGTDPSQGQTDVDSQPVGTVVGKTVDGLTVVGKSNATKEGSYQGMKERKIPLLTVSPKIASHQPTIDQLATQVLQHLNALANTALRTTGCIPARLKDGYTVDDCILVLEWLDKERRKREPDWVKNYLDHTTPFRPANFDKYLEKARVWKEHGGTDTQETMTQRVVAKIIAERKRLEECAHA